MLVEFTGASSAGKTTLLARIMAEHPESVIGREAAIAEVFRTSAIRPLAVRTAVEDLVAVVGLVREPAIARQVGRAVKNASGSMPSAMGRRERLNRMRNAFRHIGMFLFLRRRHRDDPRIVVLDTGPVHTAHNLFIHLDARPDAAAMSRYLDDVPLADAVVLVTEDRDTIIERTLARGHRRIAEGNVAEATVFTEHALETFDLAGHHERLIDRLGTIRPSRGTGDGSQLPEEVRELVFPTPSVD